MRRVKSKWAIALVALGLASAGYAFLTFRGLAYEGRVFSPNNIYYYQLSRTYGFSDLIPRISMPGSGSDWMYYVDGYVRVYRTDSDRIVAEKFVEGMPNAQFNWFEDNLLFFGGEGADSVTLPSSGEK